MSTADMPPPAWRWKWTSLIVAGLVVLNLTLLRGAAEESGQRLSILALNAVEARQGAWWQVLTGNLVHWDARHFGLDVGAFLLLGLLYERYFPRSYPWLLLGIAVAIGIVGLVYMPPRTIYRGLSGVTAGQFALAGWIEIGLAWRTPRRWLWLAPALGLFVLWLAFGLTTGRSPFLAAEGPAVAVWAHVTGVMAALVFVMIAGCLHRRPRISLRAAKIAREGVACDR